MIVDVDVQEEWRRLHPHRYGDGERCAAVRRKIGLLAQYKVRRAHGRIGGLEDVEGI